MPATMFAYGTTPSPPRLRAAVELTIEDFYMPPEFDVPPPPDADELRNRPPVVVYPTATLPEPDMVLLNAARQSMVKIEEVVIEPRRAGTFHVPQGHFFRIVCAEGPQVGDLDLWSAHDLSERFYSGKTRALHGTHVGVGDRLWSSLPHLRPMATITYDTLAWYGWDADGAGIHDVIGTRCDPYTNTLLNGTEYHHCCHSNLARALADELGCPVQEAEAHVHDVLNVFMCTGFTKDTHQYFMKASPVRKGDYLELFAEIDLLGDLSACPGGDCGSEHSSDVVACHPLVVEIWRPDPDRLVGWAPPSPNGYSRRHG